LSLVANTPDLRFDMDKGEPIDIQCGKGADVIEHFFHNNPNPAIITGISIDMSPAFISGCQTCLRLLSVVVRLISLGSNPPACLQTTWKTFV